MNPRLRCLAILSKPMSTSAVRPRAVTFPLIPAAHKNGVVLNCHPLPAGAFITVSAEALVELSAGALVELSAGAFAGSAARTDNAALASVTVTRNRLIKFRVF